MKKILTTLVLIVACCMQSVAYQQVRLVINGGISDKQLKQKMEKSVSTVMTEINRLHENNAASLALPVSCVTYEACQDLNMLWEHEHFRCVEEEIVERVLTTRTGYQVRSIPLIVNMADKGEELGYQEAVINFNQEGIITSFYYTINPELYSKLRMNQMSDKRFEVTDIKDRMMILDYVEHFRTSYNQKDLKFLRQVFSDDALIITGKVIKVRKSEMAPSGNKVIYTTQTKQQYLDTNVLNYNIPESILDYIGGNISEDGEKIVLATLGVFSIVQLMRNVQMLIPSYDFCIPEKRCENSTDSPCEMFSRLDFPTDEFFPPNVTDQNGGDGGCGCGCETEE